MYMTTSSFAFKFIAATALTTSVDALPLVEQAMHLFEPLTHFRVPTIKDVSHIAARAFLPNKGPVAFNAKKPAAYRQISKEQRKKEQEASGSHLDSPPIVDAKISRRSKKRLVKELDLEPVDLPPVARMLRPRDLTPLWARDQISTAELPPPTPTASLQLSAADQMKDLFQPSNKLFPAAIVACLAIFFVAALVLLFFVKKMCHMPRFANPRDYPASTITEIQQPSSRSPSSMYKASGSFPKSSIPDVRVSLVPVMEKGESGHSRSSSGTVPSTFTQFPARTAFAPRSSNGDLQRPERSHVRMASTFRVNDGNRGLPSSPARAPRASNQASLGIADPSLNPGTARRQGYERNFT